MIYPTFLFFSIMTDCLIPYFFFTFFEMVGVRVLVSFFLSWGECCVCMSMYVISFYLFRNLFLILLL